MTAVIESMASKPPTRTEVHKIQADSVYLTFNAPQVDEYHRGIFISIPILNVAEARYSGVLFHASYSSPTVPDDACCPSTPSTSTTPTDSETSLAAVPTLAQLTGPLLNIPKTNGRVPSAPPSPLLPPTWHVDERVVRDVSRSPTLVLFYRVAKLDTSVTPIQEQVERIRSLLRSVPLGRENRERELGPLREDQGNKVLEGYDCIIWTVDALSALQRAGVVDFGDRTAEEVLNEARAIAGPKDARKMVGKDFGGLRVMNQTSLSTS